MTTNIGDELQGREFRLQIEVGGAWKGVHVQNQSQADGAQLVRHAGQGNRVKLVKSAKVPDGYHLLVEVGGTWKGVHVQNQSADDNVNLIRHTGDGNVFKVVKNAQGTYNLLLQAHENYAEWKGVHVQNQRGDDGTALIRHRGDGNGFQLEAIAADQKPIEAPKPPTDWEKLLAERDQKIADLAQKLTEQDTRLADLAAKAEKCGACDDKIAAQQKAIDDLDKKLADLARQLADAKPVQPVQPPAPPPADDLETIEGIGPKIAELLKDAGIRTYKDLASADIATLKDILKAGGNKFARSDVTSWPKQAQLTLEGKKDELKAYQDTLRAGRAPG